MRSVDISPWLSSMRFGDLAPGQRFRFIYGPDLRESDKIFVRMKGNRYRAPNGRTFITGAKVTVKVVDAGTEK